MQSDEVEEKKTLLIENENIEGKFGWSEFYGDWFEIIKEKHPKKDSATRNNSFRSDNKLKCDKQ